MRRGTLTFPDRDTVAREQAHAPSAGVSAASASAYGQSGDPRTEFAFLLPRGSKAISSISRPGCRR